MDHDSEVQEWLLGIEPEEPPIETNRSCLCHSSSRFFPTPSREFGSPSTRNPQPDGRVSLSQNHVVMDEQSLSSDPWVDKTSENWPKLHPTNYRFSVPATWNSHRKTSRRIASEEFAEPDLDDIPLDEFDKALLGEPVEDRHSQAQSGQARLSLPQRQLGHHGNRPEGPSHRYVSRLQTPPINPHHSSSPAIPSSPTYRHSQKRDFRWSNRNSNNPSDTSAFNGGSWSDVKAGPPNQLQLAHAPPMVQGIRLIPTSNLPDSFRAIFRFPLFNAVQSRPFEAVYKSDDNVVIAAPTGSGKTVVMELAICRVLSRLKNEQYKVVYQAPTKSLCAERHKDWQSKFSMLGLQCAELTGDTEQSQLRAVQSANIIITTPEKWDSMTRKWKDHTRLIQLVKLFLIDEVHILKDTRGATLEAVVSRMKSIGSGVRFVALSATVPNAEDVAIWLGKDAMSPHLPAYLGKFGEEFRPVRLQKFVYGYEYKGNDFAFDKVCENKLPEIIQKHGNMKPIMIFCSTRQGCIQTSKSLAKLFNAMNYTHRLWRGPKGKIFVQDPDLRGTIAAGVAFHHAGLGIDDRQAVEKGFLEGQISIICCTSTLAVGVNLPCYLVIVKNTICWQENTWKEYADLEVMQMLGRAGRPQFETHAVAVIMTKQDRVAHFEKMMSGQECLESRLHLNLINHLNAEIGLGTVNDMSSAKRWLAGTFLHVRLGRNPSHYKIDEVPQGKHIDEWLEHICEKDIHLLRDNDLIESTPLGRLKCTVFGDAMARYYVNFETMKLFMSLPPRAKMSEMLSALAQADEFREIRLKSGERSLYKEINKSVGIKYPIKADITLPAYKVSLSIQTELGGVDFPPAEQFQKLKYQFGQDKNVIFQHVNRLIRCLIDCNIERKDSVAVRHALELARSFGAKVWDNSPLQLKQLGQIGIVSVRKLASAGITSLEMLETMEADAIDRIMSKNPPFGHNLLARLKEFPKPMVMVKMMGKESKPGNPVKIKFKTEIGFLNERTPAFYNRNLVYVVFMAETSDGRLIDFRRMAGKTLGKNHEMFLSADLYHQSQYIMCHVSCDEIAGTSRYAELKHDLPASIFPARQSTKEDLNRRAISEMKSLVPVDDFGDDGIDDNDLLAAARAAESVPKQLCEMQKEEMLRKTAEADSKAIQLENGKWACNHNCKDKKTCKHLCCRDGLDHPPKIVKKKDSESRQTKSKSAESGQTTLNLGSRLPGSRKRTESIETLDLTRNSNKSRKDVGNADRKKLGRLHEQAASTTSLKPIGHPLTASYAKTQKPHQSYLSSSSSSPERPPEKEKPSDYEDSILDGIEYDLAYAEPLLINSSGKVKLSPRIPSSPFENDASSLQAKVLDVEKRLAIQPGEPSCQRSRALQEPDSARPFDPIPLPVGTPKNSPEQSEQSSGSKLFFAAGSDEHLAEFARNLAATPRTASTKRVRSHHDDGENKMKRQKSGNKDRQLEILENEADTSHKANERIPRDDEDRQNESQGKENIDVTKEEPEHWWEAPDMDQDFLKEFGAYVNFVD